LRDLTDAPDPLLALDCLRRQKPKKREARRVATPSATAEENKVVVLRYVEEVWNRHDLNAIDGLVSPEYVNHAATTDEYRYGGARRICEWLLSVFPDHRFDLEDAAADGQTVAVRGTMVGTHEGELMGIAPTGRRVAAQQSHWFRVEDGKVAEHWAVRGDLSMLQQLGVMPS
jgi:predicted ester cyclase